MRRALIVAALSGYVLVLVDLTLWRFPQPAAPPNWVPLATIAHYVRVGGWEMVKNLVGNVVIFLPMGFVLPALHRELRSAVIITTFALCASVLIESLQYASGQRVADVDDVFLNTLGGFLGYVACSAFRRPRTAGALARAAS